MPTPKGHQHDAALDELDCTTGQACLTGSDIGLRPPVVGRKRDAAAGRNTAGYVTGYLGFPLSGLDSLPNIWGLPALGRWKWLAPDVHLQLLADNNTRLWVFSPSAQTSSDPAAMIGYCDQAQGSNRAFFAQYRSVGGNNGHFDIHTSGQQESRAWGSHLAAVLGDLAASIREVLPWEYPESVSHKS